MCEGFVDAEEFGVVADVCGTLKWRGRGCWRGGVGWWWGRLEPLQVEGIFGGSVGSYDSDA